MAESLNVEEEGKVEKMISCFLEEYEKDEAFRKNPYICEHSVDHYYYLLPRAKRCKFLRKKRPTAMPIVCQSTLEKKSLKLRISLKYKRIERVDERGDEKASMERKKIESKREDGQKKRKKNGTFLEEERSKWEDREKKRRKIEPILPIGLPDELKEKISRMCLQISEVKLVIQKVLYDTDLSYKHMRMSIPMNQVKSKDFLTPQQKMDLEKRDIESNKKMKIQFNLIEPSFEETKIHLAKWDMNKSSIYVLFNDWMQVVERNKLKSGMVVQLWSFHQDLVPWLALVLVP
ncbi:B3 domain-containing protein At5g24050-like [Lycium ferocissimum]|uniref:B3 domain-containing protein At5g24050-like n=1 Tax=Lycium ferocissimum TaxID=112874 RepID=UPI002816276C|nr:B3 domain-containing protein At5g24050-like [Lycium ferocissimum]